MTIAQLLLMYNNTVNPPVSTAEGVSKAITWFNIVEVFALETPEEVPNGNTIIFACEESARNADIINPDYDEVNNDLVHVHAMLYAITQQNT